MWWWPGHECTISKLDAVLTVFNFQLMKFICGHFSVAASNCQWYSSPNSSRSKLCEMIESIPNPRRRKLFILFLSSSIISLISRKGLLLTEKQNKSWWKKANRADPRTFLNSKCLLWLISLSKTHTSLSLANWILSLFIDKPIDCFTLPWWEFFSSAKLVRSTSTTAVRTWIIY